MSIRARYDSGKFAIYTIPSAASTDNAPLTAPLSNLSRLKFHSDLDYVQIDSIVTGSVTLSAKSANTQQKNDTVLFAHGKASAPMVFGILTNMADSTGGGKSIPIASNTPVPILIPDGTYDRLSTLKRYVGLMVDDTYVYLREYGFVKKTNYTGTSGSISGWPSVTLNYSVSVTNFLVTGPSSGYDSSKPMMRVSPGEVQFGRNKFSSTRRHLHSDNAGTDYVFTTGRHITITTSTNAAAGYPTNLYLNTLAIEVAGLRDYSSTASVSTTSIQRASI